MGSMPEQSERPASATLSQKENASNSNENTINNDVIMMEESLKEF